MKILRTACILAGGLGTRLREVVKNRQKVTAEIGGRPFIARLIEQVASAGIRRAVLCTGYLGEEVEGLLGKEHAGVKLLYSPEDEPLGTGGALAQAFAKYVDEPLALTLNGDSYCGVDLAAIVADHRKREKTVATLTVTEVADTSRYGEVIFDEDGTIHSFAEKAVTCGPGWINAGIYVLHASIFEAVAPGTRFSLERDIFPRIPLGGLRAFPALGHFIDIGTPESYAVAAAFFAEGKHLMA